MALLTVKNLAIDYQGTPLVQGVSFTLNKGKTLCLVGASGSGKTLTARSVLGLLPETMTLQADELNLDQQDLLNRSEKDWRSIRGAEIGMVFQEPLSSLNPVMTAGAQVAEVLQLHSKLNKSQRKKRVLKLFEQVQLDNPAQRFEQYPHELSGGQRQRVMIAIALAMKPKLLIADEPTTALDVSVQGEVIKLIEELQAELGMAVLFITHDFGLVERLADHVIVMENGKAVEQGTVKQVVDKPKHTYTKKLLAARPQLQTKASKRGKATPILEVKNLTKSYTGGGFLQSSKRTALQDVSLTLNKGETLGVVGESGSGKSTLARCLTRLEKFETGQILFNGVDLAMISTNELRQQRRNMQMIFQDPFSSLNPRMKVGESIAEGLRAHKIGNAIERAAKVAELLTDVGLEAGMADRYPHQFSGGQRQRICIARALALEPKLLIADEATSALDVLIQRQILDLLHSLREKYGLSLLFISHDLRVVSQLCDRVVVLQNGQVVEQGTAKQIFEQPSATYTQELLANLPSRKAA